MDSLAERLREVRRDRKMTQEYLAEKANVSRPNLAKFETGKSIPTLETLSKIADALDVSIDYLLGRTNSPFLYKHDIESEEYVLSTKKDPPTPEEVQRIRRKVHSAMQDQDDKNVVTLLGNLSADLQSLDKHIREIVENRASEEEHHDDP